MILIRHGQSEFNVIYGRTRVDPGIEDPVLTEEGRRQAAHAADWLAREGVARLVASPYRRTLETVEIIARRLGLGVTIEPSVRERCAFVCDVGSPRARLMQRFPDFDWSRVTEEQWWPAETEPEEALHRRCDAFRARTADCPAFATTVVVTHWGFIRGLTGHAIGNGDAVRFHQGGPATILTGATAAAGQHPSPTRRPR